MHHLRPARSAANAVGAGVLEIALERGQPLGLGALRTLSLDSAGCGTGTCDAGVHVAVVVYMIMPVACAPKGRLGAGHHRR
jgi:hypothetical protein